MLSIRQPERVHILCRWLRRPRCCSSRPEPRFFASCIARFAGVIAAPKIVTMVRSCVMSDTVTSSLHQFRYMHDYQHTDSYRSRERERWYSMTINFPEQKTWCHSHLLKHLPQARKKDQDIIVRPVLLIGPLLQPVSAHCPGREEI